MAETHKLVPKRQRLAREKADQARQAVIGLGLPEPAAEDILVAIARHESGANTSWKFNMVEPSHCLEVWEAIRKMPLPDLTRRVFDHVITHLEPNTGAVTLTREELAERCETAPQNISSVMTRLEAIGVIRRKRLKVEGMRGLGPVRYYLNPSIAWNGRLEVRAEEARKTPAPFTVVQGGKL